MEHSDQLMQLFKEVNKAAISYVERGRPHMAYKIQSTFICCLRVLFERAISAPTRRPQHTFWPIISQVPLVLFIGSNWVQKPFDSPSEVQTTAIQSHTSLLVTQQKYPSFMVCLNVQNRVVSTPFILSILRGRRHHPSNLSRVSQVYLAHALSSV